MRKVLGLTLVIAVGFLALSIDERAGLCGQISLDEVKETFWGQPVPGAEPVLFAPKVFTAELGAHGRLSFSPEGREILFSSHEKIYYAAFDGKSLSPAKVAPFVDSSRHNGPVFSPDGERRLSDPELVRFSGWSGIQLNDLYIDPQERFLIGSIARSDREPFRIADLVISFRQADGAWGELQLLNDKINTDRFERFPCLSLDGRFLFYARSSEAGSFKGARYYWVAAETLGISGFPPLFTIFPAEACILLSGCIPYSLPGFPAILFPHL